MRLKILGVSSGLGASLFPFKKYLVGNIECRGLFHTTNNENWVNNFGSIQLIKTISKPWKLDDKPNIIISSPDCGSGSVLRYSRAKELGDHKKNISLILFFSSMEKYKPKFFLFENLDGLFKSFKEEDFRQALSSYRLVIHNTSVSAFGNSQYSRKRLIIVGIREDLDKRVDKYFKLPNLESNTKTCKELYGDLTATRNPEICHERESYTDVISIHARKRMRICDIQEEWVTRLKGKKRWTTTPEFKFSTAPGVYRNLDDDYPSTARKANRQFDGRGLMLTPRQLARIQGVPDEFKLHYDPKKHNYWINKGRTVVTKSPPYEISLWFKRCLIKLNKKQLI